MISGMLSLESESDILSLSVCVQLVRVCVWEEGTMKQKKTRKNQF